MPPCTLCNNFKRKPRDYRVAFDCDLAELELAVQARCIVCSLMRSGIAHFEPSFGSVQSIQRIYVWGPTVEQRNKGTWEVDLCIKDSANLKLEIFLVGDERVASERFPNIRTLPTIPGDTASEKSFTWASRVLQNCLVSHRRCNQLGVVELPSRVLDLGIPGEKFSVRLLETSGDLGTYVCLSHCWGETRSILTERATLSLHCNGIALSSLPATFRDAIDFTRKLGLRYLWIDSLCIVQDDPEDWRRESSRMASIYQGSFITIAATKSANDCGGCYSTIEPSDMDHELKMPVRDKAPIPVYIREKIIHFDTCEFDDLPLRFPLLTRAWAFQERLLAPRVLHFCKKELVWECREFSGCECQCFKPTTNIKQEYASNFESHLVSMRTKPEEEIQGDQNKVPGQTSCSSDSLGLHQSSTPLVTESMLQTQKKGRRFLSWFFHLPQETNQHVPEQSTFVADSRQPPQQYLQQTKQGATTSAKILWHGIVNEYSGLQLSVRSDRLPAVSGLALQVGSLRTAEPVDNYLAGLWRDSLAEDLLWRVDERLCGLNKRRLKDHHAPSWSWASVDGKVSYWTENLDDSEFNILRSVSRPAHDKNYFGESAGGEIEVRADIKPVSVAYNRVDKDTVDPSHYSLSIDGQKIPFFADYCLYDDGPSRVCDMEKVYCLGSFVGKRFTVSLVIRKIGVGTKYERIGIIARPHVDLKETGVLVKVRDIEENFSISNIILV